jgi:hypothetical protein
MGQYSYEGDMACSACDEGYACDKGSSTPTPPENLCPKGYYCKTVSSATVMHRCPKGKYGIAEGAIDSSWCIDCVAGFICGEATDDFSKYPCPPGYYCVAAVSKPTP